MTTPSTGTNGSQIFSQGNLLSAGGALAYMWMSGMRVGLTTATAIGLGTGVVGGMAIDYALMNTAAIAPTQGATTGASTTQMAADVVGGFGGAYLGLMLV